MTELLTTAEVAALSRRHEDTVLDAARHGCIKSMQSTARGARTYWRRDVIDWIERGAPYQRKHTRRLRAVG